MADIYPPTVQRLALLTLLEALGCRSNALHRDLCDDWLIEGISGHIMAVPGVTVHGLPSGEGFQIFVFCTTARQWGAVKKAMEPFTEITNDVDTEGVFFLRRLPTVSEAAIIRTYVGLRKKRELSEESLVSLREHGVKWRFQPRGASSRGEEG